MSLLDRILGPESKYDKSLPYTYEARIPIIEGEEEYNSYFSDTICGLLEYLHERNIGPEGVSIYEVYLKRESLIDPALYTTANGKWLFKPEICESFKEHYLGHILYGTCSFKDRGRDGCGP